MHHNFKMKRIGVFCGSSMGNNSIYKETAAQLGRIFLDNNFDLIYGGANVGLMKILADTMLGKGSKVIGIMPTHLINMEVAHFGIDEMHEVKSMSERKLMMAEMADAFIALPGGFGTLDEISEMLTLSQLRIIDKPLGLLNINHYFDFLIQYFDFGVKEGFIRKEHKDNIIIANNCNEMIQKLKNFKPVCVKKWLEDIKIESDKHH